MGLLLYKVPVPRVSPATMDAVVVPRPPPRLKQSNLLVAPPRPLPPPRLNLVDAVLVTSPNVQPHGFQLRLKSPAAEAVVDAVKSVNNGNKLYKNLVLNIFPMIIL